MFFMVFLFDQNQRWDRFLVSNGCFWLRGFRWTFCIRFLCRFYYLCRFSSWFHWCLWGRFCGWTHHLCRWSHYLCWWWHHFCWWSNRRFGRLRWSWWFRWCNCFRNWRYCLMHSNPSVCTMVVVYIDKLNRTTINIWSTFGRATAIFFRWNINDRQIRGQNKIVCIKTLSNYPSDFRKRL